jgi:glycine/D-amino acid oxidase-like deaminating enzyme
MGPRVAVIGAGAFGGWTALELVRRGARVTLIEAWGPGHARSSSGGETRVIRAGYGSRAIYTRMAVRALALWRAHEARYGRGLFRPTGVLWMCSGDDAFGGATMAALHDAGQPVEELAAPEARRRYPQIDFGQIRRIFFEPEAGVLLARRACEHVADCVTSAGGEYRRAAVASPVPLAAGPMRSLPLTSGESIGADAFVFACGPWLPQLFPDTLGGVVRSTRQDVYYFGTPPGDALFTEDALPVWIDVGARILYGIPGNTHRGFKIADDTAGPEFDPTAGERVPSDRAIHQMRAYLARRFPALGPAPCIGAEVCQYASTPDAHFVVDRHPQASNVWVLGGGSGHGFKMGPAIGEIAASAVLGRDSPDPAFSIARFGRGSPATAKWD